MGPQCQIPVKFAAEGMFFWNGCGMLKWEGGGKMDPSKTGRLIAKQRRMQNLTQEQLAQRIGVSNKTISKWENGVSLS